MKKALLVVLVALGILSAITLRADTALSGLVNDVLGINTGTGKCQLETYYDSFTLDTTNVDPNNLESIFSLADLGTGTIDNMDDFTTGAAILQYTKQLANREKIVRDASTNLTNIEISNYLTGTTKDTEIKKTLELYIKYQQAAVAYMSAQNSADRQVVLPGGTAGASTATTKSAMTAAKTAFDDNLKSITDETQKTNTLTALKSMHANLKITKPTYGDADVIPASGCDATALTGDDTCAGRAKNFVKTLLDKGKQPQFVTVEYKTPKSCVMDKVAKTVSGLFRFGQLFCDHQVKKNGIVGADGSANTASLGCLSAYDNFGNSSDNTLLNPYLAKLKNVNTMNLALLTAGATAGNNNNTTAGTTNVGGFTPTDIFADNNTSTTTTTTNTNNNASLGSISSTNNTGDGVTRFNASTAVTSFYEPAASTYKSMASGASSLVKKADPIYSKVSSYNTELSSAMVSANAKVSSLPDKEKQWAVSTLNNTANVSSKTSKLDLLRLQFSEQQAAVQAIMAQMVATKDKIGLAQFLSYYGPESQQLDQATKAATYEIGLNTLKAEGTYASTRLALLLAAMGGQRSTYYYNQFVLNTHYMYAANGNKGMQKALKLENLKTPLTLKQGWEKDFQNYINDMSSKSVEAKKAMNEAKDKIKKLISQKLPVVPFDKWPQPGEIRDELLNMESIKQASLRNMKVINKAMAYHNSRQGAYTAEQYGTFKNEHDTVNGAMKRTVSSINMAEEPVSRANEIVRALYKEVPRSEALRIVAKQMVEQGL